MMLRDTTLRWKRIMFYSCVSDATIATRIEEGGLESIHCSCCYAIHDGHIYACMHAIVSAHLTKFY